jgi:hypothetical protein
MMMKTNLSPATQAVRRDLSQIMHEMSQRCRVSISATDTLPITLETNDASLQAGINSLCAAALLAAADQVVPSTYAQFMEDYEFGVWTANDDTRTELLAIAAELKALDD